MTPFNDYSLGSKFSYCSGTASFPRPSDVPLNIRVNPNPYGKVVKALPSSSSHSSLRDNGLECPEARTSATAQFSFPGCLANIGGA